MSIKVKIGIVALLFAVLLTPDQICQHLGFGESKFPASPPSNDQVPAKENEQKGQDYFVNDTVLKWDDRLMDWQVAKVEKDVSYKLYGNFNPAPLDSPTIEIKWETLMDIFFKLRYFYDLDLELYAPIFNESIDYLNGKKISIEGFVIPFDEDEEVFALSSFPYASCFFCGQASPASILSMQMKENSKSYKLDDYKRFSGTLYLNYDNPDEFCYVLRDAEEIQIEN